MRVHIAVALFTISCLLSSLAHAVSVAGVETVGTASLPNLGMTLAGTIPLDPQGPRVSVIDPQKKFIILFTGEQRPKIEKIDLTGFFPARVASVQLPLGELPATAVVIDPSGTYAYFALIGLPSRIVKFRTSDLSRVATLNLADDESYPFCGVMDKTGTFAYFGLSTAPGKIIKIDLSNFTRASALTLDPSDSSPGAMAIDHAGAFAYVGTIDFPAHVVKIDLATFTRQSAIPLPSGEYSCAVALIDPADTFLYLGCEVDPAAVVKVRLSDFTRVGSISFAATQTIWSGVMDPTGFYAYFALHDHTVGQSKLEKIDLSTFTAAKELQIGTDFNSYPNTTTISPDGVSAYVGTQGDDAGSLVQVDLANFTPSSTLSFAAHMDAPNQGVIDATGHYAYYIEETLNQPVNIEEVDLTGLARSRSINLGTLYQSGTVLVEPTGHFIYATYQQASTSNCSFVEIDRATLAVTRTLDLNADEKYCHSGVVDPLRQYAYLATAGATIDTGKVVRVDLSTMQRVDAIPLTHNASGAAIDPAGDFAYFIEASSPGVLEKIRLSDFTFGGGLQLVPGELPYSSVAIDPMGRSLYYGTNTSPGQIVKIDLASFLRVGKITLDAAQLAVLSAAIDPTGRDGYFIADGFPPDPVVLVKVDLATFTPLGTLPVLFGSVLSDKQGDYLFGTIRGAIQRVGLNSRGVIRGTKMHLPQPAQLDTVNFYSHAAVGMQRVQVSPFQPGQFTPLCSVIDSGRRTAYYCIQGNPAKIVRVNIDTLEVTGTILLQPDETDPMASFIDGSGQYAYFGCFSSPGKVVRIRLSDFVEESTLTFNPGEGNIVCGALDPTERFAYFGCNVNPPLVVKVQMSNFTRVSAASLNDGEGPLKTAFVSSDGANAYFGAVTAPAKVIRVNLTNFARDSALTFNAGETQIHSAVVDSNSAFAYFGTGDTPGKVVKVQLSNFTRADAMTMNSGEDDLDCAVIDPSNQFAIFGVSTGGAIKIDLSNFTRSDRAPFFEPDGLPATAIIDGQGQFAWFGCSQNPARIVKVDIAPKPLRLGLLKAGSMNTVWQSPPLALTQANALLSVPASSGIPSNPQVPAGDYFLAWQLDSDVIAGSYTAGADGDGMISPMPFGPYPSNQALIFGLFGGKTTADRWTSYITYQIRTTARGWMDYK